MKFKIEVVGEFDEGDPNFYREYEVYVKRWWWPFWSLIGIQGDQAGADTLIAAYERRIP